MFRLLNKFSTSRTLWLLLAAIAVALELFALWLQHVMLLRPCVMCIYERFALLGIILAGLLGAIVSNSTFRFAALALWIFSAWKGLELAWAHAIIQMYPSPFSVCDLAVRFPTWLPLDRLFPQFFVASADCAESQWTFMTLGMPQWLVGVFGIFLLVALLTTLAKVWPIQSSS